MLLFQTYSLVATIVQLLLLRRSILDNVTLEVKLALVQILIQQQNLTLLANTRIEQYNTILRVNLTSKTNLATKAPNIEGANLKVKPISNILQTNVKLLYI